MALNFKINAGMARSSAARALIFEAASEMENDGVSTVDGLSLGVDFHDEVFYATAEEGDVIGVLPFYHDGNRCTVRFAYVEPSSRKEGVFRAMWDALMQRLNEGTEVTFEVSTFNEGMAELARRLGGRALALRYVLTSKKGGNGGHSGQ